MTDEELEAALPEPWWHRPRMWFAAPWVTAIGRGFRAENDDRLVLNYDPYSELGGYNAGPDNKKYLAMPSAAALYQNGSVVERLHVVRLLQPTTRKITPDDKWAHRLWLKVDPARVPAYMTARWLGFALLQYLLIGLVVAGGLSMGHLGWRESGGFVIPAAVGLYVVVGGVVFKVVTSRRMQVFVVGWILHRAYPQKLIEEREEYFNALALAESLE